MADIFIKVTYENAEEIVMICRNYQDDFDVDLQVGRHVVDATSILGVMSLCNHIVQVIPVGSEEIDDNKIQRLLQELKPLGAYTV